jgi:hypothetical protein
MPTKLDRSKTFRETQQVLEPKEKFPDGSELSGSRLSLIKLYKKVVVNLFTIRALLFLLYSDARRGSGGDGGGGSSGAGGERGMDAQHGAQQHHHSGRDDVEKRSSQYGHLWGEA